MNKKSLNFLTHQEIFNRAIQHLLVQGRPPCFLMAAPRIADCGGCPVGCFIRLCDCVAAMEGVPIRYIAKPPGQVPAYGRRPRRELAELAQNPPTTF